MRSYNQLSFMERQKIYLLLKEGKSCLQISKILGRPKSTITREISRNGTNLGYLPDSADRKARLRQRLNVNKIKGDEKLKTYILEGLHKRWSPEQISGRMKATKQSFYACSQTIYDYIYQDQTLTRMLPNKGKKKWKHPPHPADLKAELVPIKHRPKSATTRSLYGHWEADTIFFERKTKENVTVLVERKSRLTMAMKNQTKKTENVLKGMQIMLNALPTNAKQTITMDQGKEFTIPEFFKKSIGIKAFYCDKGKPWQKGTVENTNARIRRFLPKNTNIKKYQQKDIENIIYIINNTPRKILGFKTPNECWKKFINRCTSK